MLRKMDTIYGNDMRHMAVSLGVATLVNRAIGLSTSSNKTARRPLKVHAKIKLHVVLFSLRQKDQGRGESLTVQTVSLFTSSGPAISKQCSLRQQNSGDSARSLHVSPSTRLPDYAPGFLNLFGVTHCKQGPTNGRTTLNLPVSPPKTRSVHSRSPPLFASMRPDTETFLTLREDWKNMGIARRDCALWSVPRECCSNVVRHVRHEKTRTRVPARRLNRVHSDKFCRSEG